ncbi:tetratricopeptide repeat protein [Solihabitans fulvus]|uniref:Tetratricopeptide repeat protein n=1 Tax=Solihabitans fulvus TaxID=1892852 RepID=A0A5B2WWH8_9PSEU|nr:BTAD domain-containing putative transcriptional regulator [Solihabitans fulvus]KAA2256353.1 tetratricopeptide repeat protein [Solihabitans fulvus]
MEFRILGSVEVSGTAGTARLAGSRQLTLLSTLLLHANHVVPVDQLTDALWHDAPPANAAAALRTYVFRLRRVLAATEPGADRRITFTAGYRLRTEAGELDLEVFRDHVRRARAADRPSDAAEEFRSALALWRGPACGGVASRQVRTRAARLEEERLTALEARIDTDLALGRHAELVPELRDLVAAHRFRERLHGDLILALHGSGRRAEALHAFRTVQQTLVEELGVDPGTQLRELHQRILRRDPELTASPSADPPLRRNDLPHDIIDFTGRDTDLAGLLAVLPEDDASGAAVVIQAIDGMAGIGKTALAIHAAHHLAGRYPDAQLFIDLHGHTPDHRATEPVTALDALLRAVGVPGSRIPQDLDERSALWRSELAERKALVVLDNAATAAQVRPLLLGASGCLVLVTSRRRLSDLDAASVVSLDVLPVDDATDLFARVVGHDRAAAEPEQVRAVVALCGQLPLAIRIAAARLRNRPAWTVAHLAHRLSERRQRLTELTIEDSGVTTAFELSYHQLTAEQRRLFRLLGLVPGADFDACVAAALTGTGQEDAERLLEELVDMHLLQQDIPGRYRFHDLLRQHAADCADRDEPEQGRTDALRLAFEWCLHSASAADRALTMRPRRRFVQLAPPRGACPPMAFASRDRALDWCEVERANLVAAIGRAAELDEHETVGKLALLLSGFFNLRKHWDDWISTHGLALTAFRRLGDREREALVLGKLGIAYEDLRQFDRALDCLGQAKDIARATGDRWTEGATLVNLGRLYHGLGQVDQALDHHRLALVACRETNDVHGEAATLNNIGDCLRELRRYPEAVDYLHQALTLARDTDNRYIEGFALHNLGEAHHHLRRFPEAVGYLRRALDVFRQSDNRYLEAFSLHILGAVLRATGRQDSAREAWLKAVTIFEDLGAPETEDVRASLAGLDSPE